MGSVREGTDAMADAVATPKAATPVLNAEAVPGGGVAECGAASSSWKSIAQYGPRHSFGNLLKLWELPHLNKPPHRLRRVLRMKPWKLWMPRLCLCRIRWVKRKSKKQRLEETQETVAQLADLVKSTLDGYERAT